MLSWPSGKAFVLYSFFCSCSYYMRDAAAIISIHSLLHYLYMRVSRVVAFNYFKSGRIARLDDVYAKSSLFQLAFKLFDVFLRERKRVV